LTERNGTAEYEGFTDTIRLHEFDHRYGMLFIDRPGSLNDQ
jgi:peptide deformylase